MKTLVTTLCFLRTGNNILLARRKKGFGSGKYNGIGGKLEEGETVIDALIRETKEEIGVIPTNYEPKGKVQFDETIAGEKVHLTFHVFIVTEWDGAIAESEEMAPEWFDVNNIPYDKMFSDDIYWLPRVLCGKSVDAYFRFDEEWNIVEQRVDEVEQVKEMTV